MTQVIVDADQLNHLPQKVKRHQRWLAELKRAKDELKIPAGKIAGLLAEGKREGFI